MESLTLIGLFARFLAASAIAMIAFTIAAVLISRRSGRSWRVGSLPATTQIRVEDMTVEQEKVMPIGSRMYSALKQLYESKGPSTIQKKDYNTWAALSRRGLVEIRYDKVRITELGEVWMDIREGKDD